VGKENDGVKEKRKGKGKLLLREKQRGGRQIVEGLPCEKKTLKGRRKKCLRKKRDEGVPQIKTQARIKGGRRNIKLHVG